MLLTKLSWALALARPLLAQHQHHHHQQQQQKREDGYFGYKLSQRGDEESAIYKTANTDTGKNITDLNPIPDVYLNASVNVGLIDIQVDNITAKVNVDAKVLNLLHFRAGVDASIDRVRLRIENVSAEVELEARLENVVEMVGDVLNSIDLNPIIATLGQDLGDLVGEIGDDLGGGSSGDSDNSSSSSDNAKRDYHDFKLEQNILFSVNDYSGQKHRNRVLAQNGSIIDMFLNNAGDAIKSERVVGYYANDMTFTGHNRTLSVDGDVTEYELQYLYAPYPGLEVFSNIFQNPRGQVVRTQVIAEAEGGGTSTISEDDDEEAA